MASQRRFAMAAAAIAILALLPAAAAGTTGSGLYGTARKGPITPVCRTGVPCDAPARVTLTFESIASSSNLRVQVRTNKKGRYRVALPPGFYTVKTGTTKTVSLRPIKPGAVHVRKGRWDRINFFVDTGIR
jgi:hypothetical protein